MNPIFYSAAFEKGFIIYLCLIPVFTLTWEYFRRKPYIKNVRVGSP